MHFYFNPLDKTCKSHTGAVERDAAVTFCIHWADDGAMADVDVQFVLCPDGKDCIPIAMQRGKNCFSLTLRFHQTGLYFYYFRIGDAYFGCGDFRLGRFMQPSERMSWQITVHETQYTTPDWLKGGVMYQIFPDRFYKVGEIAAPDGKILRDDWGGTPNYRPNEHGKVLNNDFFGGNLNGVTEKLDYLKSLGVTAIYFNPIFEAYSNHRYDTGDYMRIDPLLGTVDDFDRLISEGKERGIRVILDGVFNHTGSDSRYFNKNGTYDSIGAYQSTQSPYYDWYDFQRYPDEYSSWWGIDTLPAVNEHSQSYQQFIFGEYGVLKTWLRHGIGGYRLDVADELPDFFLEKLRTSVKESDPDAVIIGEVWEDASNKIAYSERRKYLQGRELDSVMNYPLKEAIIDYVLSGNTKQLRETIALLMDHYPKQSLDVLMNILGTHDTARILTALGGKTCSNKDEMAVTKLTEREKALAKEKLMLAAVLQFTLPGVPCIYYGDENGMEGYRDPFCRRCFDWTNTDGELLSFYRKLGRLRSCNPEFSDGEYKEIFADEHCLVYARTKQNRSVYVYINNSYSTYNLRFDGEIVDLMSNEKFNGVVPCSAKSYRVFRKVE